ncbi:MAG TPA: carotenoid biosynthesis protein, partial [Capillimicrobium sp.]
MSMLLGYPRRSRRTPSRRLKALLGALAASQVAYSQLPDRHRTRATQGIVGLFLAAATVEAAEARGARRGPALVAGAGAIGFGTEVVGVATGKPFGHYTYSAALGPRALGVSWAAAAAWAMMARPAWVTAGWITRRRAPRA